MRVAFSLSGEQAFKLLARRRTRTMCKASLSSGSVTTQTDGVQQDKAKTEGLWRIADGLGSPEARIRLIVSEIMKIPSKAPSARAISYLQTSSEEASILAQVALAYCHERGLGKALCKESAALLYRNAAQRGSESAYLALRRMHHEIRPAGMEFEIEE